VTPGQLAADVVAVRAAGCDAVYLHVKDDSGVDTFDGERLREVLAAVRDAAPGMPVGVTTGAWALSDPGERVAAIRTWPVAPDFASVNWHEEGAEQVAGALLDRGIGVEAGLWHEQAVAAWSASPARARCVRVLLELPDGLDARSQSRPDPPSPTGRNPRTSTWKSRHRPAGPPRPDADPINNTANRPSQTQPRWIRAGA